MRLISAQHFFSSTVRAKEEELDVVCRVEEGLAGRRGAAGTNRSHDEVVLAEEVDQDEEEMECPPLDAIAKKRIACRSAPNRWERMKGWCFSCWPASAGPSNGSDQHLRWGFAPSPQLWAGTP